MKPLIIIALAWGIVHAINYRLKAIQKEEKPVAKKRKVSRETEALNLLGDLALFILAIIFVIKL